MADRGAIEKIVQLMALSSNDDGRIRFKVPTRRSSGCRCHRMLFLKSKNSSDR